MIRIITIIAGVYFLAGCSLFSGRSVPQAIAETPEQWQSEHDPAEVSAWLDEFNQPALRLMIDDAFEKNPNLLSQAANVQLAIIQARIAGADRWPELSAGLGSSRNKRSNTSGFSLASLYSTSYNLSLDISWELDVWGRLGNGVKAAFYEQEAAKADFQAARYSLVSTVLKAWFDGIEAKQQLALSDKTVENFQQVLEIVESGYDSGLYRALDVRLARSNLLGAVSRQQRYQITKNQTTRSLEILLGRYPSAHLKFPSVLPALSQTILAGVPGDLLNRRPDILAAKRRFKALDQRHIKAKKDRLPALRLSGSGGTSTNDVKDLLDSDFIVWNFASGLLQPLFQGGRLDAQRDEAYIRWQQAESNYRNVVLQAFNEVETLLFSEKWLGEQQQALSTMAKELHEAEILASEDYVAGLTDINTLLQTQRQAFDAQSSLLEIRKEQLHNRINLYLALGGPVTADELMDKTTETHVHKN